MTLKCACCGFEKEFTDAEEAFRAGWDAPPHFPYVGCDLCPGALIAFGHTHQHAAKHEKWAREGRPAEFEG
jgi:hypothetical protein